MKHFNVRCRGIILHEGKMLMVRHPHHPTDVVLPGGHLEFGEDPKECIHRELVEELGVVPVIGRLLYVNTFMDKEDRQPVEFFFEIMNGDAYLNCHLLTRTHAHELVDIVWVAPTDDVHILPEALGEDFRTRGVLGDEVRFMKG
ncbi:NUDIX domain-containing protein [Candidatus Kaiserbacteria bacterium]|nr:MAG: NUDIX domain-containing protein [Candidatus Kaiserbacteria bacterium]